MLFSIVLFSPSLTFAEVNTDKSVYSKGELITISGTLDLQDDDERVNIVEIEIIDSDNDTILNAYTPVNDNGFSHSYDTVTWIPGNYKVIISYNDVEDSAEFEIVSSSSDDVDSNVSDDSSNEESEDNQQDSSSSDDVDSNVSDDSSNEESEDNQQDSSSSDDVDSNVSDDSSNEESEDNQQDSSSTTLSDTIPDPPIDLNASVISATQIDLYWSLSDESDTSITGFKIEARTNTDPNYSVIVENTENTDTTYSHTDLTPDTVYAYRVQAVNSVGESEPSGSTTVKTSSNSVSSENTNIEDTDVPTNLVATAISPTSIELSWDPPTQTYGQNIQGYTVKQEIAPSVYSEIANTIGSEIDYIVSDLKTGESYTFVVSANYLRGSSDVSETATATLSSSSTSNNSSDDDGDTSNSVVPTGVPDSPTDLNVKPVLSTQIDLSWTAPENDSDDNDSIIGYKIEVRTTNDSSYSTVIEDTENTDTTYSHTGLIPNTTYIYRVYAINDIGTSEPSSENLANTLITDPNEESDSSSQDDNNNDTNSPSSSPTNVPSSPVDLQATPISQNRINLSWSMPIDSNGSSPLLGYKIESKTSEESDYSILVTNTGNASITSYSHTGLTAGLTYQYRVSAINSFGESMSSDMVEATIISSDNTQTVDETQSQQLSVSPTLQPLQVTLSTDKAVYGPNDSVEISGTINNSGQTIPLGLRVVSSNDVIVYARSVSIDDNSFETVISPLQRQSSAWQVDDEFTVEVTYNGRIQATTTFTNNGNNNSENSFSTSNESSNDVSESIESSNDVSESIESSNDVSESIESSNDVSESIEQQSTQSPSETSSTNDPMVISNNEFETLKNQNTALQSVNQQLQDENDQLKSDIEDLTKKIEQLDLIVKEQMRVMLETLGIS